MGEGGGDEEEDGESEDDNEDGYGVEVLPNGQEHDGARCTASTSELVQCSGQLQTTVVTLLLSVKLGGQEEILSCVERGQEEILCRVCWTQTQKCSRSVTTSTSPHPGKTMSSVIFPWTSKVFMYNLLREK